MNKSMRFSKYKPQDRPFNMACSEGYSENLDNMSLILVLLQNDPPTSPRAKYCLALKYASSYL